MVFIPTALRPLLPGGCSASRNLQARAKKLTPVHAPLYPAMQQWRGHPVRHRRRIGGMEQVATVLDGNELEDLLQRCAAQDSAALRALYERAAPQLLAVLLRILRVRATAEDALQDVFSRIWPQAGQFDRSKGRALSWMVAIARNRAIDLQRASRPTVLLDA